MSNVKTEGKKPQKIDKRKEVINEIIRTEQTYVDGLYFLERVKKHHLKRSLIFF